jgi:hypothetical protein
MTQQFLRRTLCAAGLAGVFALAGCGGAQADAEPHGQSATAGGAAEHRAASLTGTPGATQADEAAPMPAGSASVMAKVPAQIRGIYLNAYAAGSSARLPKLIAIADNTEINAFVVDVKDEKGLHYRGSSVALADELTPAAEKTIRDLKAFVDTLHAHDIYAIARIVVFKDPVLSKAKPDWSIRTPAGGLWVDKAGNTWVSPWDEHVWDYNIQIAEEVARAGFDMIQFDYVRFPEPYRKTLPPQVHPHAKGDRTDAIAAFLNAAKQRLHPLGVPVAADVFGLTPNTPDDLDIGQQWETISATADVIKPMVYPSHYLPTHLKGVPHPNRMPFETVLNSVGMAVVRNQRLAEAGAHAAQIIPWLQAFNAPWVDKNFPYGPEQAKAQIDATYDVGLDSWIFWHPGSKYEQIEGAFAKTLASHKKPYTPSEVVLSTVALHEKQGVLEARKKAAEQARGQTTHAAVQAEQTGTKADAAGSAAQ